MSAANILISLFVSLNAEDDSYSRLLNLSPLFTHSIPTSTRLDRRDMDLHVKKES